MVKSYRKIVQYVSSPQYIYSLESNGMSHRILVRCSVRSREFNRPLLGACLDERGLDEYILD